MRDMKTRVPVGIALFALTSLACAATSRVNSYARLIENLDRGETVKVVLKYKDMTLLVDGKEEPAPDAVGGMTIHNWERFAKGVVRNEKEYIAISETQLIAHPRYGHVWNYVRLRVYGDGSVEITARYLTPTDFKVVMDETFKSKISDGKDKFGVHLFATK